MRPVFTLASFVSLSLFGGGVSQPAACKVGVPRAELVLTFSMAWPVVSGVQ